MNKPTPAAYQLHPNIFRRWSPRAFDARPIDPFALRSMLEAARWAASCFNEQPWRVIVALRQDTVDFERMLGCLADANRRWAKDAAALLLTVASTSFARNGKPNPHCWHDVGLAMGQLSLQATHLGLAAHQMAGFDRDSARKNYGIPQGYDPVAAIAVGYASSAGTLPDDLRQREVAPRQRHPQQRFVFSGSWQAPLELPQEQRCEAVLDFWLGRLDDNGLASKDKSAQWWSKDSKLDDTVREQFAADHAAIHADHCESWLLSGRGRLAYVIVLDQFSRNMHRGTPQMFASDARALKAAREGIDAGLDHALAPDERAFLYMPLMHSEALSDQERCVELFARLCKELAGSALHRIENNLKYARAHRDIVARFGRFPHRNAILGRPSTAGEEAFLEQPGSSF